MCAVFGNKTKNVHDFAAKKLHLCATADSATCKISVEKAK
jgi:hypothetical protein